MIEKRRIFSDLDNTVIFSHRHEIGERVLVEWLNGKEQAFMTKKGYELLQGIPCEQFVPVTSRTKEQYDRIQFYRDGRIPKYSLIDNGGILLIDGKEEDEWLFETNSMISEDRHSLETLADQFSSMAETKLQDNMVLFIKTQIPFEQIAMEAEHLGLISFRHMDKIYVCSGKLSKGNAVRRFKERFPANYTVVAGDSEVDLPMVYEADKAYLALQLENYIEKNDRIRFVNATDISELMFGR